MSNLFISHSSRDNAAAQELQARLEEQGHRSVFLDLDPETGIQAGVSWERTLYTKLRACRAVVALCSDSYLASQWCFAEIALARMEGKELFVLQIDPWSEQTQMPSILTEEQYIDLRTNKDDGYQRLWNGFKVKGIVPAEQRQWGPDDPPYPGLRAFEETDAPIFFGREPEVREGIELLNRVERQGHPRLVMVLGSSGSGKSSLARAGLVPRLRRDGNRWLVIGPFRPGPQPARELAAALSQAFDRAGEARPWEGIHRLLTNAAPAAAMPSAAGAGEPAVQTDPARQRLLQALHSMAGELTDADADVARSVKRLEEFLASAPAPAHSPGEPPPESAGGPLVELAQELRLLRGTSGANVLLVIDQFEELLGHEEEGADHPANAFLRQLRDGLDAADSPVLALGTMRSDYLGVLQQVTPLQGLGFKSLSVGPMSPEGMKEIIERPALLGQIRLGDGLADRLMRETGSSDALPLLAFTLRVMWDRYHGGQLLEMEHYEAIGKLEGAVAQVAGETLETALELGEEDRLRDAFLSLARPAAEGSGWTRQPLRWADVDEAVQPMLQCFVDQRLLVKRGDGTVEVAHEALFRSWKTLRGWLDENAEVLHLLRDIRAEAAKWDAADSAEKRDHLWRGGRLARALELRKGGVLALEDREQAFVEASDQAERAEIDAEEARRKKELWWMRGITSGVAVGLVIFIVLFVYATQQARIAKAGRLAALAVLEGPESLERSLLLSVEAQRVDDLAETRDSLLRALQSGLVETLRGHEADVHSVAFSPQAELLATADDAGIVLLWRQVEDGWKPERLPGLGTKDVYSVAFSPDGTLLAAGGLDGLVRLWSLAGGVPRALEPAAEHGNPVLSVAFSPDGSNLASGGDDRTVRLWEILTGSDGMVTGTRRLPEPLEDHPGAVQGLAFSLPDGSRLAAANDDGTVRVWQLKGRSFFDLRGHVREGGEGWAESVVFLPDGRLVSGGDDGGLLLWSQEKEDWVSELLPGHEGKVSSLAFSRPSWRLASSGEDGTVRLWDVDPDSERSRGARAIGEPMIGHARDPRRRWVRSVAFARDGKSVASGGRDHTVRLWEVGEGRPLGHALPLEDVGWVRSVMFSSDGEWLASGGKDGVVRLWRQDKGGRWLEESLPKKKGVLSVVAISAKGGRMAAAGEPGTIWRWRRQEGRWEETQSLPGHQVAARALAFSPDGQRLASGGADGKVRLWETEKGELLEELDGHEGEVYSVTFSPDGKVLASGDKSGNILVWQRPRDGSPNLLKGHDDDAVYCLAFSPDGKTLASGSRDRTVLLWELAGGGSRRLEGFAGQVKDIAFSPDGRILASADREGEVRLWDVELGRPLGKPFRGHSDIANSVAFSPTGDRIASAGEDGQILVWDLALDSWLARACRAANRNLAPSERRQFVGGGRYRKTCLSLPPGDDAEASE